MKVLTTIIAVLTFWVIFLQVQISELRQTQRGLTIKAIFLQRQINRQAQGSVVSPESQPADNKLLEVSCYTPVESHGSVGREDGVSVATFQFPIGTWVEIEGIGIRRVDTHTAPRFAHRVDVWMTDYQACLEFGVQQRRVWEV